MDTEDKKYEVTFITTSEEYSPVKVIIQKHNGAILNEKPAQKITLSYPIKKQTQGFMGIIECAFNPEVLSGINNDLILQNSMLRFMISKLNEKNPNRGYGTLEEKVSVKTEKKEPVKLKREPVYDTKKSFDYTLTNEAIEKKIEEMLE